MGVQCRGQINIFVYISGNGMANIFFYMAYDECLRFLFRCKDHRLQFSFLNCHSVSIKISKKTMQKILTLLIFLGF